MNGVASDNIVTTTSKELSRSFTLYFIGGLVFGFVIGELMCADFVPLPSCVVPSKAIYVYAPAEEGAGRLQLGALDEPSPLSSEKVRRLR